MKIGIITDAWDPQVNGVVTTYKNFVRELEKQEIEVKVFHPKWLCFANGDPTNYWKTIKLPFYKEIEIILNPEIYEHYFTSYAYNGYQMHIATEGPLGFYAKKLFDKNGIEYTTSFHSKFPEFIESRTRIPAKIFYPYFRWFHKNSKNVMVPTKGIKNDLHKKGIINTSIVTRGVDLELFNPNKREYNKQSFILCVSRVSKEKNLEVFCNLDYPNKVLVGDGPHLNYLKKKYPNVAYVGKKTGKQLAWYYANALCTVFPSRADTFGIVILESIASGTPVLAFNEPGPLEVIQQGKNGMICSNNFTKEDIHSMDFLNRDIVRETAENWTWEKATNNFLDTLSIDKHQ